MVEDSLLFDTSLHSPAQRTGGTGSPRCSATVMRQCVSVCVRVHAFVCGREAEYKSSRGHQVALPHLRCSFIVKKKMSSSRLPLHIYYGL